MQPTTNHPRKIEWIKYVVTFLITAGIFVTFFYISKIITEKRVAEIKSVQDSISIDLLSSETEFSLMDQSDCSQDDNSILAPQLGQMGDHLSAMEDDLGPNNTDVINLKEYYSLLEIKDYILMKELAEKCDFKPVTVVYFYNTDCPDCTKQGYVLTALREQFPQMRVYSFDADLNLSAIGTLEEITHVPKTFPSLVIDGKVYTGFQSMDDIESIPAFQKMLKAQKQAQEAAQAPKKTVTAKTATETATAVASPVTTATTQ